MWLLNIKTEITEEHQIRQSFLKDVPIPTAEARTSYTHYLSVNLGSFVSYYHAVDGLWHKEKSCSIANAEHIHF